MAARHLANFQAIKAALDPLYASFSDEQKNVADGLKIGPMGVMWSWFGRTAEPTS
jgi:hypothetical protein